VQSLTRAFDLLEALADGGGALTLSELAAASGLPLPTIHRLMRSLVDGGYVRQDPSRRYALGPRLIRLGEVAGQSLGSWAKPYLHDLVQQIGETANLAMLEGDAVVYLAQVPSPHAMRMFTEVGRRAYPHSTGVGKAIMAQLDPAEVRALISRTGLPSRTQHTITSAEELMAELERTRQRGYALDEGEQEIGVRCVAVAVPDVPQPMAVSVSGPLPRMTDEFVARACDPLRRTAEAIAAEIRGVRP
jgi:IclR family acetate operon transcriptional repressor